MQIFAISALINALVTVALGLFVISYNPKSKVNRLYFLLGLAIAFWSVGYWRWQLSVDEASALFWVRILSIGSTFIPVFYFHWVTTLLERDKKEKKAILLTYILAFIMLLFSFSPLFIKGVRPKMFFQFWPDPGILYHAYLAYVYCILITYSIFFLLKEYKKSFGEKKAQIIYVIIGSFIGFGGGIFNFFLWYNIPIPPYGNFLVALYPFFLGYAVIKYRLFDIKIVATEILVFLLWMFLVIKALLSNNSQDMLINGGILIAVAIIGVLLIRGIIKDAKQKEEIEKMAKEVERAYIVEKHAKEQTEKAYGLEKKANEELKKLDKYKNEFLRQASHDLRTPLTILMGYSDMLLRGDLGKLPKKATGVIERIQDVTQKKIKDINSFLDLEQFKAGKGVVLLKPGVELSSMLEEITGVLLPTAQLKGIYLKLEKPENPFVISADKEKIESAIFNIISNAVKYTPKGGVRINIKNADSEQTINPDNQNQSNKPAVIIEVKDTGIGIPQDKVKSIFEEQFKRTEQAEKTAEGTGVGLYLSGQIIKLHKGRAWAESEGEGKGSTFYIELPVS